MIVSSVEFENTNYKIRQLEIKGLGTRYIASVILNNLLVSEEGYYTSDEARYVDEQIYFFVEPEKLEINDLELTKYVIDNCD